MHLLYKSHFPLYILYKSSGQFAISTVCWPNQSTVSQGTYITMCFSLHACKSNPSYLQLCATPFYGVIVTELEEQLDV